MKTQNTFSIRCLSCIILIITFSILQYQNAYTQPFETETVKGDTKNLHNSDNSGNPLPPGWDTYSVIGNPHGIIVMLSANPRINDIPILPGDYIGAFYEDDFGELKCGGADFWRGDENIIFGAFPDDYDTPEKDGFSYGEVMHFKVFSYTTHKEYDVDILAFDPTYPSTDQWYPLGLSNIIDLACFVDFDAYASATPNPACIGNTVNLEANIFVGTTGNYTYSWTSDPAGFSSTLQNPTVVPIINTTYFLEVSDGVLYSDHYVDVIINLESTVAAGPDVLICEDEIAHVSSTATNYSSILWTTTGDGNFNDPEILGPFYTPGPLDAENGYALLTVMAFPLDNCLNTATDGLTVSVGRLPEVNLPPSAGFCETQEIWVTADANNYSSLVWATSGDGTFSDPNSETTQYFPGSFDLSLGDFILTCCIEATNPCSGNDCGQMFCTFTEPSSVNAPSSRTKCENLPVPLNSVAFNYSSILWVTAGDGYFENPYTLSTNYIPGDEDNQNGGTMVTINAFGNGSCEAYPATKDVNVIILPLPDVNAGDIEVVCSGFPIQLDASVEDYTSFEWSTAGDGYFSNTAILNPLYYPGSGDIAAGNFDLTLTAQPVSPCTEDVSDILEVEIVDQPAVNIITPSGQDICEGLDLDLLASGAGFMGILWETTGDGFFNDPTILNPIYYHGPVTDLSGNPFNLKVTAFAAPNCYPDATDQIIVSFFHGPSSDVGEDITVCEDDVFVSGSADNYSSLLWESNGDGVFVDPGSLNTQYIPGNQDLMAGTAELCLVAYGFGDCPNASDCLVATISPNPSAVIGMGEATICYGENYNFDQAVFSGYSSLYWFTPDGGGGFNNPGNPNPIYIPNPAIDYPLGCIQIGVTAEPVSPCVVAAEDFMELCFQAPPDVEIGLVGDEICYGEDYYFANVIADHYSELVWFTVDGGGTFNDVNVIDPVYYPNAATDYPLGCITIGATAEPISPCNVAAVDYMELCFQAPPEVEIGVESVTICYGSSYQFVSAEALNNLSVFWFTVDGGGIFNNPVWMNPVYFPDPEIDFALGCITIGVSAEPKSPCDVAAEDFMDLCFQAPPEVDAGIDATIEGGETFSTVATADHFSQVQWSTSGDGYFDGPEEVNTVYNPGIGDLQNEGAILSLTANPMNPCILPDVDDMQLTIDQNGQIIALQEGWGGFSSFIEPNDPSFEDVVSPISGQLVFAQNMTLIYWPGYGINTIGDFNNYNGYKVKLNAQADLSIIGSPVTDKTVSIPAGWSIFPVLSDCVVPYTELLSQLIGNLIIITEIGGDGVLWPGEGIYNLPWLEPGKAYMVKVSQGADFTFPDCTTLKFGESKPLEEQQLPMPYNSVYKTAEKHLICFPANVLENAGIRPGSIIAAHSSDGRCAGATTWETGSVALQAYADDITTSEKDGYLDGEPIIISVYDQTSETVTGYSVIYSSGFADNEGIFVVNGVSVVDGLKASAAGFDKLIFNNIRLFPNPANQEFSIVSNLKIDWVEITSSRGNVVKNTFPDNQSSTKKVEINIAGLNAGVYFVKIKTVDGLVVKKLIVQ